MALIAVDGLYSLMQREPPNFFFQDLWLGGTAAVIDANSISKRLYVEMKNRHDCFGGDYDRYAIEIRTFFGKLYNAKIAPFVTFFGGRAIHSPQMIHDIQRTINTVQEVGPNSDNKHVAYPLWIREVFLQVLVERKIKKVQFDFEDYMSTAFISRYLCAPVIADDPNFFLYDVKYVPYSYLKLEKCDSTLRYDPVKNQRKLFKFYHSKLFKMETLLRYLALRNEKDLLPIYTAFVSYEDLSDDEGFRRIFQNLGIQIVEGSPPLKELLSLWIKRTDRDIVRRKLEQLFDLDARRYLWNNVQRVVRSYGSAISGYLHYLEVSSAADTVDPQNGLIDILTNVPTIFIENYRNCEYPQHFVDIIQLRKYYIKPQVEVMNARHTHDVSYDMISAIFKLLTRSPYHFSFFIRNLNIVAEKILHSYKFDLPTLEDFQVMSPQRRRYHFNDILILANVEKFLGCLRRVPDEWKLFLIAIKVFINHSRNWPLIYGLIISKLVLSKVDDTLGYYRDSVPFMQQFNFVMGDFRPEPVPNGIVSIKDMIRLLSFNECMLLMSKVIHNFEMNPLLEADPELYNKPLIHSLCEFQSCLLHVKYLNDLMYAPYLTVDVARTINGTFIYNLTTEIMRDRQNFGYILDLLSETPLVLKMMTTLVTELEQSCSIIV